MKLRLCHNSIRFRLSKSDLDQLTQTGEISESISFGEDTFFTYSLTQFHTTAYHPADLEVKYGNNEIKVMILAGAFDAFLDKDEISIFDKILVENTYNFTPFEDEYLSILIEKDFACLVPRED